MAFLALPLVALVAACGHTGMQPEATGSASPTIPGLDPRVTSAVLAAYNREEEAFEKAISTADPYLPDLPATMVNPLLQTVERNLIGNQNAGVIGTGTVQHDAHVVSLTGSSSVVVDCEWDATKLIYKKDGTPVPPIVPPQHVGVRATLVEAPPGQWKVTTREVNQGRCLSSSS